MSPNGKLTVGTMSQVISWISGFALSTKTHSTIVKQSSLDCSDSSDKHYISSLSPLWIYCRWNVSMRSSLQIKCPVKIQSFFFYVPHTLIYLKTSLWHHSHKPIACFALTPFTWWELSWKVVFYNFPKTFGSKITQNSKLSHCGLMPWLFFIFITIISPRCSQNDSNHGTNSSHITFQ